MKDNNNSFTVEFNEDWLNKNSILRISSTTKLKIEEEPKQKWYKKGFEYITFGLYKAPWEYEVSAYPYNAYNNNSDNCGEWKLPDIDNLQNLQNGIQ